MAMFTSLNQHAESCNANQREPAQPLNSKWTYLIADTLTFTSSMTTAIRLAKPQNDILLLWLEKIIKGGQCARIFVENLQLSNANLAGITALCLAYGVELHNVNNSALSTGSLS